MPYNPGIEYRGDQYIAAGINKLGDVFSGAIDKTADLRKRAALNDSVVSHALNAGRISQEEYNKYIEAPWGKKEGIANGIMANMHDDWQRQQFEAEEKDKELQRALQLQIANIAHSGAGGGQDAGELHLNPATTDAGEVIPGKFILKNDKSFHVIDAGTGPDGEGPVISKPLFDADGNKVKGKTVVTKTGSNDYKIVDTPSEAEDGVLRTDPTNSVYFDNKNNPHSLPAATRRNIERAHATPTPTPAPGFFDQALNAARRQLPAAVPGSLAATPAPDPTPSQTPVPSVVAPAPASEKVKVFNPEGKPFNIPRDRLKDYLNAGWTAG